MTPEDRLGHRQRLREKFEKHEQDAFLDYELLELILTYSIPRRDVKPIAKELMNRFHTFPGVMDARPDDLAQVPGLGQNSITLLKLIRSNERLHEVPVVLFSSLINEEMRRKGDELGANGQIAKPEINQLIGLLDELIFGVKKNKEQDM